MKPSSSLSYCISQSTGTYSTVRLTSDPGEQKGHVCERSFATSCSWVEFDEFDFVIPAGIFDCLCKFSIAGKKQWGYVRQIVERGFSGLFKRCKDGKRFFRRALGMLVCDNWDANATFKLPEQACVYRCHGAPLVDEKNREEYHAGVTPARFSRLENRNKPPAQTGGFAFARFYSPITSSYRRSNVHSSFVMPACIAGVSR